MKKRMGFQKNKDREPVQRNYFIEDIDEEYMPEETADEEAYYEGDEYEAAEYEETYEEACVEETYVEGNSEGMEYSEEFESEEVYEDAAGAVAGVDIADFEEGFEDYGSVLRCERNVLAVGIRDVHRGHALAIHMDLCSCDCVVLHDEDYFCVLVDVRWVDVKYHKSKRY